MFWINGQRRQRLPLSDRAMQFGDGFFTTARLSAGQVCLLPYHLERLEQAGARLMFTGIDWSALRCEMIRVAELQGEGVLKVVISRGSGGKGYGTAGCGQPLRILSHRPAPAHYAAWREAGVELALSPVRLARNPLLAGIKHLNRLEQVLIRTHLDQAEGAQEAVVLDTGGHVIECCAANLFWRTGSQVFTPDLSQAGVEGVMRRHILALLEGAPYTLKLAQDGMDSLLAADEALICNALMPVLPVRRIEGRRYTERRLFDYVNPHC